MTNSRILYVLYAANVALFLGAIVWLLVDPGMDSVLFGNLLRPSTSRGLALAVLLAVAAVTQVLIVWTFLWGQAGSRHLKHLLVFVALIGLWSSLFANWKAISWQGRRLRMLNYLAHVESLAQPLNGSWPTEDGESPGIGPFMAYPVGAPTTLILLTPPRPLENGPSISAIEKGNDGSLRLELGDADGYDWLEWHPDGTEPTSHVGGLMELRELIRSTYLKQNWYLVRYRRT